MCEKIEQLNFLIFSWFQYYLAEYNKELNKYNKLKDVESPWVDWLE